VVVVLVVVVVVAEEVLVPARHLAKRTEQNRNTPKKGMHAAHHSGEPAVVPRMAPVFGLRASGSRLRPGVQQVARARHGVGSWGEAGLYSRLYTAPANELTAAHCAG